jgi:hypothetical protein
MRNLAARIERLEADYNPAEIAVILLTHFGDSEIKGWRAKGFYVARKPGESEEALASRAATEAQAYHNQYTSLSPGYMVLQMDREDVSGASSDSR